MKKIISSIAVAISVCGFISTAAHAGDAPGFHVNHEAGVKVYRGSPTHLNYQAVATLKALELEEQRIKNQNRQANAQIRAQSSQAQQRLDLDRRVAFTRNEIFSSRRNRSNRRFVTGTNSRRGFGNSGRFIY